MAFEDSEVPEIAAAIGNAELEAPLRALLDRGLMTEAEAVEEAVGRVPELQGLIDAWQDTPLKMLTLTSVGIAIGHGQWKSVTQANTPLSVWID
jgi:hypothetical protein